MIELLITAQGTVRTIYTEAIPIQVLGHVQIERASHVEPDAAGNWWTDLRPSHGPVLGPFNFRSAALQAEHDWLTRHVLFGSPCTAQKVENLTDDEPPSPEVTPASNASPDHAFQTPAGCFDLL